MGRPDWTSVETVLTALESRAGLKALVETGGIETALRQCDIELPADFDGRSAHMIEPLFHAMWILQNETRIAIAGAEEYQRRLDLRQDRIAYLKIMLVLANYLLRIHGRSEFQEKLAETYGKIPETILAGLKETVRAVRVAGRADLGLFDLTMSSGRLVEGKCVFHAISHVELAMALGLPKDVITYREIEIESLLRELRAAG